MTDNTNVARVEPQEVDHAPQRHPATILDVIQNIASNPEIDIERMSALLKLRAEEEDRIRTLEREDRADAAKRAYLRDMATVQSELEPIRRDIKNEHTKKKYADLAAIDRAVTPILTKHGFSTDATPLPCDRDGYIRERLTISHAEGHEKHYEDDFPLDDKGSQGSTNKTPIQAKGSTRTYARRYLKTGALDLAFEDDNDGNAPQGPTPTISADQFRELKAAVEKAGGFEAEQFINERFGLENVNDLRLQDFGLAMTILTQKAKKLAEEKPDA